MGNDLPPVYDWQPQEQINHVDNSAKDRLSVDALYLLASDPVRKKEAMSQVLNQGAVDKLNLPNGWEKGSEKHGIAGTGSSITYNVGGKADVELTFFDRGRNYPANAGAYKDIVGKAPHELTPAEIQSLGAILGHQGDPRVFKMSSCRTEELNGKHVLVVEGVWNAVGHESLSVLVSPDGSGQTIQEIYFKAPPAEYKQYLPAASDALKSIRWK